jgi:hypothetical protein
VEKGRINLSVDMLEKNLSRTIELDVNNDTFIIISIVDDIIDIKLPKERFSYF